MDEEEPPVAGRSAALAASVAKSPEQVKNELRGPVRRMGTTVAERLFMDPDFQATLNWWMIRTHIAWGISLAMTFVGLNEGLIAWQQAFGTSNFIFFIVFTPLGMGYLLYQTLRFKKPKAAPVPASSSS